MSLRAIKLYKEIEAINNDTIEIVDFYYNMYSYYEGNLPDPKKEPEKFDLFVRMYEAFLKAENS